MYDHFAKIEKGEFEIPGESVIGDGKQDRRRLMISDAKKHKKEVEGKVKKMIDRQIFPKSTIEEFFPELKETKKSTSKKTKSTEDN